MRGVARSRETGQTSEHFVVLREPHCRGFDQSKRQTVQQWIDEQGVADCNEINDKLMQIISLKNNQLPGILDIKSRHLFFTALYDLDSFRSQIINNNLLEDLQLDKELVNQALEGDDVALLEVGMMWIRRVLFD